MSNPTPDLGSLVKRDYDAEMRLPTGVSCDDCAHSKRCFGFGFSESGRTSCDFWPSRFRALPTGADHG